jgi:hypothetical protein
MIGIQELVMGGRKADSGSRFKPSEWPASSLHFSLLIGGNDHHHYHSVARSLARGNGNSPKKSNASHPTRIMRSSKLVYRYPNGRQI